MSNNKQSSVEWYAKQIEILHYDYFTEHISKDEKNQRLKQLKEQAKAIHRTEIIESYASGSNDRLKNTINTNYYNETFNQETK